MKKEIHGFSLQRSEQVPDLHSVAHIFVHEVSGAHLLYLENDDPEKVFSIAFKTVPQDSTGVFHILEHSVLCGSDKYPLREPFVDLLKSSMQTFLNAMTFSDKTMYPVASMNEKDFLNLMSVYLDAVFCPRIYKKKEIFMQEGWHLEIPEEGDPYFNGVVYNEMKGAFSRADRVMYDLLSQALFPDTTYSFCSGGAPEHIPELTYEQFLHHHRTFYHPENSFIFLYGQMDLEEKLAYIDQEYLAKRPRINSQIEIKEQKPIGFVRKNATYVIGEEESEERNAKMCMGYVFGDFSDRVGNLLMDVICESIAGSNESPLKKAVLSSGFCEEFSAYVDAEKYSQLVFELHKADQKDADRFKAFLHEEIAKICEAGIDREAMTACLNIREFTLRENDHYGPAGLNYAIDVMGGWLYGADPIPYLSAMPVVAKVRELLETTAPEELLRKAILESNHSAQVVLSPSKTLKAEQLAKEKAMAKAYFDAMTKEEVAICKAENASLRAFQTELDTPEAKATLPHLSLDDLSPEVTPDIPTEEKTEGDIPVLHHPIATNGIVYTYYYFDVSRLDFAEMSKLSLLCKMLSALPTANYTTAGLDTAVKTYLGSLSFGVECIRDRKDGHVTPYVVIGSSAIEGNMHKIGEFAEEVALTTRFDREEVKRLLQQELISYEQILLGAGNYFASTRARASKHIAAKYEDVTQGYGFLEYLRAAVSSFDNTLDFCDAMTALAKATFTESPLLITLSCEEELYQKFFQRPVGFANNSLQNCQNPPVFPAFSNCQAVSIPAAVAFDALCYNMADKGFRFVGKLSLLSRIVSLDYLWNKVRVQGGAYGVTLSIDDDGLISFSSYRDPNVTETLDAYKATADYLRQFEADEVSMAGYIIGVISGSDKPLRPKRKAKVGDVRYLSRVDRALRQANRTDILSAKPADMVAYADMFAALAGTESVCVVAGQDKISKAAPLFESEK